MATLTDLQFPKRFLWGASVSAHQVEGNTHNQWTVWELENAKSLAQQAKYRGDQLPEWKAIESQATSPSNYVSGKAADHYNRYPEDFTLLKNMNLNAFRFSIEWSRIEPEEGRWDAAAIEHYREYLKALHAKGIEPIVTLWHWTLPVWFADMGGFEKRRNIAFFERFVRKVFEELGREFRYVITLNEPEVYVAKSYLEAEWPPQKRSKKLAFTTYLNLITAHKRVHRIAKASGRKFIVGIAKNCAHYYAGDDAKLSQWSARIAQWGADYFYLNRVRRHMDFIGLNYYFSNRFYGYKIHNPNERLSDMGWDMQPANIQFVLERLHAKYKLPLIVTENGCADASDQHRKWWLSQTLVAMNKALQNGVNLQGYLHWSLLDNFEWSSGFWPRFGLIAVDRATLRRTPRGSAVWWGSVVKKLR